MAAIVEASHRLLQHRGDVIQNNSGSANDIKSPRSDSSSTAIALAGAPHQGTTMNRTVIQSRAMACLIAATGLLGACGGSAESESSQPSADVVSPLMSEDRSRATPVSGPIPPDTVDRSTSGRSVTPGQAALLERSSPEETLRVEVACCNTQAEENAIGWVYGMQAALALPDSVPVLVEGSDVPSMTRVGDRLNQTGFTRVWLVTR